MTTRSTDAGAKPLAKLAQKALLEEILSSISYQKKDSTFACGGSVNEDVQIRFGENRKGVTLVLPAKVDNQHDLDALIAACSPAAFGRGKEKVIDEEYRKAGKLDPSDFLTSFCPYGSGIVDVVSQILLPNTISAADHEKRTIRAELYKMNVYSAPSGKFKPHCDTPRSEEQFGSLVVALPVEHTGGQLVVRHDRKELTFDWSSNENGTSGGDAEYGVDGPALNTISSAASGIKWAAFHSDCEHEVLEVTSGNRLTLTYNLYVTRTGNRLGDNVPGLLNAVQTPLYATLKDVLNTPGFFAKGRVLALYLTHCYAHTDSRVRVVPASLKGADLVFYEAARELGPACCLRPVASIDDPEEFRPLEMMREDFVGHERTEVIVEGEGDQYRCMKDEGWTDVVKEKVTWLNESDRQLRQEALTHATYGNEPGTDTVSSHAALFIRIPASAERGEAKLNGEPQALFYGVPDDEAEPQNIAFEMRMERYKMKERQRKEAAEEVERARIAALPKGDQVGAVDGKGREAKKNIPRKPADLADCAETAQTAAWREKTAAAREELAERDGRTATSRIVLPQPCRPLPRSAWAQQKEQRQVLRERRG